MSRLFTLHASAADTADHFGVAGGAQIAVPLEMVEGDSGPVIFDGGNRRMMKTCEPPIGNDRSRRPGDVPIVEACLVTASCG